MSEALRLIEAQIEKTIVGREKAEATAKAAQSTADAHRQAVSVYQECIDELERDKAAILAAAEARESPGHFHEWSPPMRIGGPEIQMCRTCCETKEVAP